MFPFFPLQISLAFILFAVSTLSLSLLIKMMLSLCHCWWCFLCGIWASRFRRQNLSKIFAWFICRAVRKRCASVNANMCRTRTLARTHTHMRVHMYHVHLCILLVVDFDNDSNSATWYVLWKFCVYPALLFILEMCLSSSPSPSYNVVCVCLCCLFQNVTEKNKQKS